MPVARTYGREQRPVNDSQDVFAQIPKESVEGAAENSERHEGKEL
jgi:hypothetical protein